ncbi:putative clathrin assembly protein [Carex littledalei]|uniref:Putative clathrin assembly protein n=1 Tax=Carex littledalei TaxID=544730 RepID=A0A833QVH5_9POAL|nr:putative clathrin assembly protein [Carex littledalei]
MNMFGNKSDEWVIGSLFAANMSWSYYSNPDCQVLKDGPDETSQEYYETSATATIEEAEEKEIPPPPKAPQIKEEPPILVEDETEEPVDEPKDPPPVIQPDPPSLIGDLLGLDEINPVAAELEETNALALAIVPSGENSKPNTAGFLDRFSETSGWELALVTAESGNTRYFTESTLAGGFDKLLLDSLYEDTAMRQQMSTTNYGNDAAASNNPNDPFAMSSGIAPPTNVQMSMMMQQNMMMQSQPYQHISDNHYQAASPNPFGDPFLGLGMLPPGLPGSSLGGNASLI